MAKVALPLVRHGELNPEEKTCSVLVYWTILHINKYQSFYMQTSELIVFTEKSVSYQGLEIVDVASADSVLLI